MLPIWGLNSDPQFLNCPTGQLTDDQKLINIMTPSKSFFFFFFWVICSLHFSLCAAAWVTFNGVGSNRACFLLQLDRECFMPTGAFSLYLGSLSLSSIHILRIESLILQILRASDRVPSERRPARLCGRSRACACFVSNFPEVSIVCDGKFSWRRDSILCPSERMN